MVDNDSLEHDIVRVSDCCDGSDEYESSIRCPNTCVMGGNLNYVYKPRTEHKSTDRQLNSTNDPKELKTVMNLQDMVKNLQGFANLLFYFDCLANLNDKCCC